LFFARANCAAYVLQPRRHSHRPVSLTFPVVHFSGWSCPVRFLPAPIPSASNKLQSHFQTPPTISCYLFSLPDFTSSSRIALSLLELKLPLAVYLPPLFAFRHRHCMIMSPARAIPVLLSLSLKITLFHFWSVYTSQWPKIPFVSNCAFFLSSHPARSG